MDAINQHILKCLQSNARQSNAAIGRQVGISSPAVAERIKKMEDAGVILAYQTAVSPLKLATNLRPLLPYAPLWVC